MSAPLRAWSPERPPRWGDRAPLRARHRPGRPRLPTFLVIGAQKAGTSWLHRMLGEHPRIFVTERKELHFFSNRQRYAEGMARYREHFAEVGRGHRAVGESTPNYLWCAPHRSDAWGGVDDDDPAFRAGIPARVVEHLGTDLRVVVLLRDPVDRAVSAFYHHLRAGRGRIDPDAGFLDNARRWGIVTMGFYAAHLERWLAHLPPERFLVLLQEEMVRDPASAVAAVHRHLGVRPRPPAGLGQRVHTGDKHRGADGRWYLDEAHTRVAITPADLAVLREVYAPENARLQALLGRPLTPWPSAADGAAGRSDATQ